MIDLVEGAEEPGSEFSELRSVLLAPERQLIEQQRIEIDLLQSRIEQLEQLVVDQSGRAEALDEVLVQAIEGSQRATGDLGRVMEPELRHAFHISARENRSEMAEAIYPLVGPAVRKMIAAMFSLDKNNKGRAFRVEQILLIDRATGLMIASTATDERAIEDADVVSGMLDAVASFVQDAFEASEDDGLEDLRVGDLSVLVENGPRAALASVVRGAPTPEYRQTAAATLEEVHMEYYEELVYFDGSLEPFDGVPDILEKLHDGTASKKSTTPAPAVLVAVAMVVLFILVLLIFG